MKIAFLDTAGGNPEQDTKNRTPRLYTALCTGEGEATQIRVPRVPGQELITRLLNEYDLLVSADPWTLFRVRRSGRPLVLVAESLPTGRIPLLITGWIIRRLAAHHTFHRLVVPEAPLKKAFLRTFPIKAARIVVVDPEQIRAGELQTLILRKAKLRPPVLMALASYIEEKAFPDAHVTSRVVGERGKNNYGCLEHRVHTSQGARWYFTKIVTLREKERLFYTTFYQTERSLQEVVPPLHALTPLPETLSGIPGLTAVTTERITGQHPRVVTPRLFGEALRVHRLVTAVPYQAVAPWLPLRPPDEIRLFSGPGKQSSTSLLKAMAGAHDESVNATILNQALAHMEKRSYSQRSRRVIRTLQEMILERELYREVCPGEHYRFLHGDFGRHNLLRSTGTGRLYLLDWGSCRAGPAWTDRANFFASCTHFLMPYTRIRRLLATETPEDQDGIEGVFFIYTLILLWLVKLPKGSFERAICTHTGPALRHLRELLRKEQERTSP
ncbi:hypothetical protein AU468_12375 [Alkalispirochaeta sphaeroplastigenens]|uniref:Aminoglycoside phosphotransferase domain-containing protein n=1 Tax=Alkalispirochaeta sphaeroplastigenens TaxID=1187066 RepID=A0A2S4JGL4_9SPIO|nr:phosphotransferase [Alkalispirochaeta sphaeroplastigenens]POQ98653.1 hypothetical protein AU468_12375 [Alkalispirochaeta sphaeroplastigenens]